MLVIVMCIAGLLLLMGLSLAFLTGNSAFTARKLTKGVQALAIAEAGVADMLSRLQTNYVQWMEASNSASFGGGTYSVSTTLNMSNAHITIRSTGTIGNDTRTTVLEILGEMGTLYDRALGVNGVMLAGGNITVDTGAIDVHGNCHANGSILHDYGNTTIDGDTSACGVNQLNASAGYTNKSGVAPIVIPDYRPFTEWETLAKSNGLYYATSQSFNGTYVPPNGVMYVNGDASFATRSAVWGTIVASGKITFNNKFTHTPFITNWPCMLAGGDIELYNRDDFTGVIFSGANIYSQNHKTITGALIAMGNIDARNRLSLWPMGYFPAWDPNDTNQLAPDVLVGGWLQ